jgi:hypothetical protein
MTDFEKEMMREDITLLFLLSLIPISMFLAIYFSGVYGTELKKMNATIIEHNVTSTRGGDAIYNSLIRYENGKIENITSKELYLVPIGSIIQKEVRVEQVNN